MYSYVPFCVFCFTVLFCVLSVCKMYTVLLPPGVNPLAVKKYTNVKYETQRHHFDKSTSRIIVIMLFLSLSLFAKLLKFFKISEV